MMIRYVVTCVCQNEIHVEPGRAGDTLVCQCGRNVQVPKLGELRLLPRVEQKPQRPAWGLRNALVTVFALVAIAAAVVGGYMWTRIPALPPDAAQNQVQRIEQAIDSLTPVQAWDRWQFVTKVILEQGLDATISPDTIAFQEEVEQFSGYRRIAFAIAGIFVLAAIALALWGTPAPSQ